MKRSKLSLVFLMMGVAGVGSAQPETAPPPREKLTPAELLVGRWRLEKVDGRPVPPTAVEFLTFTAKGRVNFLVRSLSYPDEAISGSYKLNGKIIEFCPDPPAGPKTVERTLVVVTKTRLITQERGPDRMRLIEYVRDEGR